LNEDTPQPEPFRRLDRKAVYRGRVVEVFVDRVERPDGTVVSREIVAHPGAVAIVAALPSGEILLVRQERPAVGVSLWEIPAGTLEPGERPLDCAKRELSEETGFVAETWREALAFFTTPGFSDERITLFFAESLQRMGEADPREIAECRPFALGEIREMIEAGTLIDAKSILALLLFERDADA
jgi:ADP-ribose pyrophosphatase